MLVTGSCHATDTLRCPKCGTKIALDTNECGTCGVRIFVIRRPRNKNHRTEKAPSGDSVIQNILETVSISGRTCGISAHMSFKNCICSSDKPSIATTGNT